MKLTSNDILGEGTEVKKGKVERVKPEKTPKKRWGRKQTEPEPNVDEPDETATAEENVNVDDVNESVDTDEVVEETEGETDVDEDVSAKGSKLKIVLLVLAAVIGFVLIVIGVRGVLGRIHLEQEAQIPIEYDSSYDPVLDASEENFDQANAERELGTQPEGEAAVPEGGEPAANGEAPADGGGIVVENPENKTSPEEEIALLKAEIDRLNAEVANAQNNEALKDQELNNVKAMLDASTARESALQAELDAAKAAADAARTATEGGNQ